MVISLPVGSVRKHRGVGLLLLLLLLTMGAGTTSRIIFYGIIIYCMHTHRAIDPWVMEKLDFPRFFLWRLVIRLENPMTLQLTVPVRRKYPLASPRSDNIHCSRSTPLINQADGQVDRQKGGAFRERERERCQQQHIDWPYFSPCPVPAAVSRGVYVHC